MITENLSTLKIHKLTQAQYERELAAGRIDENALYLTPDEEGTDGNSIHYCTDTNIYDTDNSDGSSIVAGSYTWTHGWNNPYFPYSIPKVNDFFVTASKFLCRVTNVYTEEHSGMLMDNVDFDVIADLNGGNGKSAYQYAQDGGYTGTEQEFAEKLALEPLIGTTAEITPQQVVSAMVTGTPFTIIHSDKAFGDMMFNSFAFSISAMNALVASVVFVTGGAKFCAQLIGDLSTNVWAFTAFQLAGPDDIPEVPTALQNPHALTINGNTYDGSSAVDMTNKINAMIDAKLGVIENGSY